MNHAACKHVTSQAGTKVRAPQGETRVAIVGHVAGSTNTVLCLLDTDTGVKKSLFEATPTNHAQKTV